MKMHLKYLDGLRAVAALYVVLHHCYIHLPQRLFAQISGPEMKPFFEWLLYGHFAVDLFIVLSGFCLTLPVLRDNIALEGGAEKFYRKRARRILPPYYFALALSLILIHYFIGQPTDTHWDDSIPVTQIGIWIHVLLIHDIFFDYGGEQINHALWTIPVEVHIYIFFPLFVWCARRFGVWKTGIMALALSALAAQALLATSFASVYASFYGLFVLGALAAVIAYRRSPFLDEIRRRFPWWLTFGASAAVLTFCCYETGINIVTANFAYVDYVVGFVCAFLLIALALSHEEKSGVLVPIGAARILSARFPVFLGSFAYSLYLIHAPLIQVVWLYVVPRGWNGLSSFCVLVFVGLPLILCSSYLFFLCCERPFLSQTAKKTTSREAKALRES